MSTARAGIVSTYAEWTALSALRSGAPIKSRRDVYGVLRAVDFGPLFEQARGPISSDEFDEWHRGTVEEMMRREPRLQVGWAAKIINVYLKTRVYVAGEGRPGLAEVIHPPIDSGLWLGLTRHFGEGHPILSSTNCVSRIRDIDEYPRYALIISGCRTAAEALGCSLIEVEQLWRGTEFEEVPSLNE